MSRGFTLIELLVVLTIVGLISGGSVVYLNRSNGLQKLDAAKQELLSNLRFARDLAITNQKPFGFGTLSQVRVNLSSDGIITAWPVDTANGVGASYFSKDTTQDGVVLTLSSIGSTFGFSAYEGRFKGESSTLNINISSTDLAVGDTKQLVITQSGLINDL